MVSHSRFSEAGITAECRALGNSSLRRISRRVHRCLLDLLANLATFSTADDCVELPWSNHTLAGNRSLRFARDLRCAAFGKNPAAATRPVSAAGNKSFGILGPALELMVERMVSPNHFSPAAKASLNRLVHCPFRVGRPSRSGDQCSALPRHRPKIFRLHDTLFFVATGRHFDRKEDAQSSRAGLSGMAFCFRRCSAHGQ